MAKIKPTPELIEAILIRVPEGLITKGKLWERLKMDEKSAQPDENRIGRLGDYFYDPTRLTADQVKELRAWCRPSFPAMSKDGHLLEAPIAERQQTRRSGLSGDPTALRILDAIEAAPGYVPLAALCPQPEDEPVLRQLVSAGLLRQHGTLIFDPLRLSPKSIQEVYRREQFGELRPAILEFVAGQPGQIFPRNDLSERFGTEAVKDLISDGELAVFVMPLRLQPFMLSWVRLKGSDLKAAQKFAAEASKVKDEAWQTALDICGDTLRPEGRDGKTRRMQVVARSYTIGLAAKRLGVREATLEQAIAQNRIITFEDPEGRTRLPASQVEAAFSDPEFGERIAAPELLKAREIAIVCGVTYSTVRYRLQKAGVSRTRPQWGQIRGRWELPSTLREFRTTLKAKVSEWRAEQHRLESEERENARREAETERQRRQELRARLVAAFPAWVHEGRSDQHIVLRVGPPNSGKTHEALESLVRAGSGWYLAPLRLLAFEIFDRLNRRGVMCNLLTGEEFIPVPGARITAATIEMFNPTHSGDCVIVDEAQMLADPDRGWAWTRALMESRAPEMHIIGPLAAQALIERLAGAAAIPLELFVHQRLAPIQVAESHWPLGQLPPRTILVAFSRQAVLDLKMELESMKRHVSVVYGNLPPEVRRRQADRFADGQTDICVATDAVGMGLNLPADCVCFYEIEKYDGKETRMLTPAEVQQIGGRAGRYGFAEAGEVGATSKRHLNLIRQLFHAAPDTLTHARVAPSVEDLEIIPGTLASKLAQWASLQSIPESLRGAIKTADMDERIELASMLTEQEVHKLGLERALKLVNAPTRQATRLYWRQCTTAILTQKAMPMPPVPPSSIDDGAQLETIEHCVSSSDIYLWLARRPEFGLYAEHEDHVRMLRAEWSVRIDAALLKRLDTARKCPKCGRTLPRGHRYRLCDFCFYEQRGRQYDYN